MASNAAALAEKLLSQAGYLKILEQRRWVQGMLAGFSHEGACSLSSPIVVPYGSTISGTSFADGDADYAVVFPTRSAEAEPFQTAIIARELQEKVLSELFAHIRKNSGTLELQPQRIFRARIPIVQYSRKGADGDSKFDLSLSPDGLKNSLLLRKYMASDPRLRLGVLCAKQWGRENQILNARRGWISPYALTIMYVHFMRATRRIALSISEDEVSQRVAAIVDALASSGEDVETIEEFSNVLPLQDADLSEVTNDVYDFFDYYGNADNFDFDVSVVDIRTHDRLETKDAWSETLQGLSEEDRWHLLGHETILLRDPFEPHNLGRSVDFFRGEEIREKFRTSSLARAALTLLTTA